jgi:hypothetical protein
MEETLRMSGEQLRDFAARLDAVREEERMRVAAGNPRRIRPSADGFEAGSVMGSKQNP